MRRAAKTLAEVLASVDSRGCFLELAALKMDTDGTEFNQERRQAVQIEDTAEVSTGSQRGKWLACRYKCREGNGSEFHHKDRVD